MTASNSLSAYIVRQKQNNIGCADCNTLIHVWPILTVPRLRRQLRHIERFIASVVIADIGTNDLSPSSMERMKLADDIVECLRDISELRGVAAVVILPITPRSKEAPAKSRHHWRTDFEEARLAVNRRVTDLVAAMLRVMTWRHVGGLYSKLFLLHDGVHMDQRGTAAVYVKSVRRAAVFAARSIRRR